VTAPRCDNTGRHPDGARSCDLVAILEQLSRDYGIAFRRYCSRRDESGLRTAYEIGRTAVVAGVGILDLVQVHHATLLRELEQSHDAVDMADMADAASCFLTEALATYEMMYRRFRDQPLSSRGSLGTDDPT